MKRTIVTNKIIKFKEKQDIGKQEDSSSDGYIEQKLVYDERRKLISKKFRTAEEVNDDEQKKRQKTDLFENTVESDSTSTEEILRKSRSKRPDNQKTLSG